MDPEPLVVYVPSAVALAGVAAYLGYLRGKRRAAAAPRPKPIPKPRNDEKD